MNDINTVALTDEQRAAIEYAADLIDEKWGEPMKGAAVLRALLAASSAATVSDAASVPADCDVRKILLRVVPGDGDGHEVYAKNVGEVEQLLSKLGERLENFESQVATASVAQDGPYGYAPIHPNSNYFTRNKSTADYVGGMVPVYARAASSATAPLTSDSVESALDRVLKQSKNPLFRSGAKICAAEILSPTKQCTKAPEGWSCSRVEGHEGPCAASQSTNGEQS